MSQASLVVMTRWPAPGRCKQRLAKGLGNTRAAYVQSRLTMHTLAVAKDLADRDLIDLKLAICGLAPNAAKRWACGLGVRRNQVVMQGRGSLGIRLKRAVLQAQRRPSLSTSTSLGTIVIGSDLADLSQRDLLLALENLRSHDMVIGPASDGGYWLLGLSRNLINPIPHWTFSGIPWGTDQVMATTIKRANQAGITTALLSHHNDIDHLDDLKLWTRCALLQP